MKENETSEMTYLIIVNTLKQDDWPYNICSQRFFIGNRHVCLEGFMKNKAITFCAKYTKLTKMQSIHRILPNIAFSK